MYDNSNIEIINFEPFADCQMNHLIEPIQDDFNLDKFNFCYLDKLGSEMFDEWSNFDSIQQSNSFACFTNSDTLSQNLSLDNISCYSDNTCLVSPSIISKEIQGESLNTSFDNCNEGKSKRYRTFPCTSKGCTKVYKSKENLTLHYKNIHLKEKPYSCKYCDAVFSHRNGKTYHERKFHTKYLPHKCSYGGKLIHYL
jgi:hypothetical protein